MKEIVPTGVRIATHVSTRVSIISKHLRKRTRSQESANGVGADMLVIF